MKKLFFLVLSISLLTYGQMPETADSVYWTPKYCNTSETVEDCYEAIKFINKNHKDLKVNTDKLIVAGDSAGGNLAAVMPIIARDDKDINISYQVLIYPVTEGTKELDSYEENSEGFILSRDLMLWFYKHYLSNDKERKDWRVSPIKAKDLTNEFRYSIAANKPRTRFQFTYFGRMQNIGWTLDDFDNFKYTQDESDKRKDQLKNKYFERLVNL